MERLHAAISGDPVAFAALYRRHTRAMHREAFRVLRTRALAEDAVQETWAVVLRAGRSFEGRSSLGRWLERVATNVALTFRAAERRNGALASDAPSVEDGCVTVSSPEREAGVREELRRSLRSLERLPPLQRVVLTRACVEGRSSLEICAELALTEANRRVLLHRARLRLRADRDGLARAA